MAAAVCDVEGHYNSVALFEESHAGAEFFDYAHVFVALKRVTTLAVNFLSGDVPAAMSFPGFFFVYEEILTECDASLCSSPALVLRLKLASIQL